jgi:AcrR family transcriptional regulator
MQAIADEADVAVQTVYAVFGTKREVLRQALEAAVTGDADPASVNDRPEAHALRDEPDPRRRAAMDAAMVTTISPRIAPIVRAVREATAADPEFASTWDEIAAHRRADVIAAAALLAGADGLTVELEDAIGSLYVLYSPDVYTMLTADLGWSAERFERWLADAIHRLLLAAG